jgi:hypothetical protein
LFLVGISLYLLLYCEVAFSPSFTQLFLDLPHWDFFALT